MKTLLFFLFCASSAIAQLPSFPPAPAASPSPQAPITSLSFYVKEVASRATTVTKWDYGDGWYNRDTVRQKKIEIEVRNMNPLPAKAVSWAVYFFGGSPNSRELSIYAQEKGELSVGASQSEKVTVTSKELTENNRRYGDYEHYSSGKKSRGYMVVITYGDGTLKPYVSSTSLGRPEELMALIKNGSQGE